MAAAKKKTTVKGKHMDEKEDKKMVKGMVKPAALKGKKGKC